ncbi:hypothetical protein EVAR_74627_1 [Eumeta japonica]|uniref:Uncharacterized protein n=1 Tax=Eumeta variegata TaxID=151549 RepID=A0A4C1WCB6_EUMVA|nr:hypothetical protein EVAR_74627_1 [Eumeta japonica]
MRSRDPGFSLRDNHESVYKVQVALARQECGTYGHAPSYVISFGKLVQNIKLKTLPCSSFMITPPEPHSELCERKSSEVRTYARNSLVDKPDTIAGIGKFDIRRLETYNVSYGVHSIDGVSFGYTWYVKRSWDLLNDLYADLNIKKRERDTVDTIEIRHLQLYQTLRVTRQANEQVMQNRFKRTSRGIALYFKNLDLHNIFRRCRKSPELIKSLLQAHHILLGPDKGKNTNHLHLAENHQIQMIPSHKRMLRLLLHIKTISALPKITPTYAYRPHTPPAARHTSLTHQAGVLTPTTRLSSARRSPANTRAAIYVSDSGLAGRRVSYGVCGRARGGGGGAAKRGRRPAAGA